MSDKVAEYKLVWGEAWELERMVNNEIELGWIPQGGPTSNGRNWAQAMIKWEDN